MRYGKLFGSRCLKGCVEKDNEVELGFSRKVGISISDVCYGCGCEGDVCMLFLFYIMFF